MSGPWAEIAKTYGVAGLVLLFVAMFIYREWWPWYKQRTEANDRRIERLTSVIEANNDISRESAGAMKVVAERLGDVSEAVTDLRINVARKYGGGSRTKKRT